MMRILLHRNANPQEEAIRDLDIAVVHLIRQANELEFKNLWSDLRGDERVRPDIAVAAAQKWLFFDNFNEAGRVLEARSEERRVGKECRSRWLQYYYIKEKYKMKCANGQEQ